MEGGPSCFPPDFSCPAVLWCRLAVFGFRVRAFHPLWRRFPTPFYYPTSMRSADPQPQRACSLVWPLSLSLAATQEIDVSFSSYGYLDVSVPRVPLVTLCIYVTIHTHYRMWVSPFGNLRVRICASNRSLSQLITSFIGSQCQGIHSMLFLT